MSTEAGRPVVLVVEGESIMRMYASLLVEDAGFLAIEASTADEALAILDRREDIRILFTAVGTPGSLNGLKLVEVVREKWPAIELIVASGHVEFDPLKLPERARFFRKPYPEHEVIKALKTPPVGDVTR
jgi:CheY-like chemotaxis protein